MYVVSDDPTGLVQALGLYFPEAAARSTTSATHSPISARTRCAPTCSTGLRDAGAAPTREEARARLARLIDTMRAKKAPAAADWLDETVDQTLAFFVLPPEHRQRLRSTNSVEHDHAEIRRRTRVVRIFPNDASLLRLISALAIERNEKWMERRYLIMTEVPRPEVELRQSA